MFFIPFTGTSSVLEANQDLMWFLDLKEGYIYAKSGRSDRDLKMICETQLQIGEKLNAIRWEGC